MFADWTSLPVLRLDPSLRIRIRCPANPEDSIPFFLRKLFLSKSLFALNYILAAFKSFLKWFVDSSVRLRHPNIPYGVLASALSLQFAEDIENIRAKMGGFPIQAVDLSADTNLRIFPPLHHPSLHSG